VTAELDGDDYVLNGRKYWPCNVAGWDGPGANVSIVVVRTAPDRGGTEGLSAIMVERGTPGVSYKLISKIGHRLTPNAEISFDSARVPAANLVEGTRGNGDLLINRNFAWSGPVAGIAAVGVARAAYEAALDYAKTYTAGGPKPIIHYQNVGYVLGDVAARIEACRCFCWKGAHYLDRHDYHGELIGAMVKIHCTELLFDAVVKCMQVVGVDSVDKQHPFEKYLREATILPLYDAGNFGMQRRRVHGVLAQPDFNPRALMEDEFVDFTKTMETIDTVPAHEVGAPPPPCRPLLERTRAPPPSSGGAREARATGPAERLGFSRSRKPARRLRGRVHPRRGAASMESLRRPSSGFRDVSSALSRSRRAIRLAVSASGRSAPAPRRPRARAR
jgi:nitroalkane oxidase